MYGMAGNSSVRPSRSGDQFHYHWAARQCLKLLPGATDLVTVTIEGASNQEATDASPDGDEVIDVALYFGNEDISASRRVHYIQLKHSTKRGDKELKASDLKGTIAGFITKYVGLLSFFSVEELANKLSFEFIATRPADSKVVEALADLANGAKDRHPAIRKTLTGGTALDKAQIQEFFQLFRLQTDEDDLWAQRNLLTQDVCAFLPDADMDAPVQLKELVTRKATAEFERDPAIRRRDVLRALKTSEEDLRPAESHIPDTSGLMPRRQEPEILSAVRTTDGPFVIHADGGVGKSVIASRISHLMPPGSEAVLYDCYGEGLGRSVLHFRHRFRDALVQIANELAARGLCYPLIPSARADGKAYMRAFVSRLSQAVDLLRARDPESSLCIIIDAADNAEMAAEEQGEPSSFVRDLIRTSLPRGVRLVVTCRTHRLSRLNLPPHAKLIELLPFSEDETARHLRSVYPNATESEVKEFAFLSSSNPRLQALALSQVLPLPKMLKELGPNPSTVQSALGEVLEKAIVRLRDRVGTVEASQIEAICQALAVLRPLVPISVLATLSGSPEGAIRSFVTDLGRPLVIKGNGVHFLDEPAETWFQDRFKPDAAGFRQFLDRLQPIAANSSYAASALPQLMLQAGLLNELVELALCGKSLPADNPIERRDVETQRLTFALKACLMQGNNVAAAKLALKAGGECAGEDRQYKLIQENTDIAGAIMAADRIEEIVSRRVFGSTWMGSHHVYDAGFLSSRDEFNAEAASKLRMATEWLKTWASLPEEERQHEKVTDADRAEFALATLRIRSPAEAAWFLRRWTWRPHALAAGRRIARSLADIGRLEQLDSFFMAASRNVWLVLGLAIEAREIGHLPPAEPIGRALRVLTDRRIKLDGLDSQWNDPWPILRAVCSTVEIAIKILPAEHEKWAKIVRRYLPATPPNDLTSRFNDGRSQLLRAYALEAALRGETVALDSLLPPSIDQGSEKKNAYKKSQEREVFDREVGGRLPWFVLAAEIACGRRPVNVNGAIDEACKAMSRAEARVYGQEHTLRQTAAIEWLCILRDLSASAPPDPTALREWISELEQPLWTDTLISLCRLAGHIQGFDDFALYLAGKVYRDLEGSRDHAEARATSYVGLARSVLNVSPAEASACFNQAIEISNRIGEENLYRWDALLNLAHSAGSGTTRRPETAYHLSRAAELTYEYVARDKHFDWDNTVQALTDLCPSSVLAILSRWRDRRFGYMTRLLPEVVYRLMDRDQIPFIAPIALAGMDAYWNRRKDLQRALDQEARPEVRQRIAGVSYRYIRLRGGKATSLSRLGEIGKKYDLDFPDLELLLAKSERDEALQEASKKRTSGMYLGTPPNEATDTRHRPNWNIYFQGVDLTDPDALRLAYAALRDFDPPYELEKFFREALSKIKVGHRPDFINAVVTWPDFGLFELNYLLSAIGRPLPTLQSLRAALRSAVLVACRNDPTRVRRGRWGSYIDFHELYDAGIVSDTDVIKAALEGFAAYADSMGASDLFQMLEPLSVSITPEEADEVLNYGLKLLDDVLRPDDGDGPWQADLTPPDSITGALAGFIWAGLASPETAKRWEYAHVVRSLVELGWTELLEMLFAWLKRPDADPFTDRGLEFYEWHARLWFMIGVARGAMDNPESLRPFAVAIRDCLKIDHVLIREFAAGTLRSLAHARIAGDEVLESIVEVNQPKVPEITTGRWGSHDEEDDEPDPGPAEDEDRYYFGIDIGPYWFAPLGRVFGLSEKSVEKRALRAMRQHMQWTKNSDWSHDARHGRKVFRDNETYHSHGSSPETDDLRAYHAFHALMFSAAELLRDRPVLRIRSSPINEFKEWISRYQLTDPSGRWVSDRRDPRPIGDLAAPNEYTEKQWCWSVTADYLDQQLAAENGMTVVSGSWTGRINRAKEDVSIRSALVNMDGAEALLSALQTAPELGRFRLAGEDEEPDLEVGTKKLISWITEHSVPLRLDEADPWGEGLRFPGPAPFDRIVEEIGLAESPDSRRWVAPAGGVVHSETWSETTGYGDDKESETGWRMSCDQAFIRELLKANGGMRLILSVEVRRHPKRDHDDWESNQFHYAPYSRYYLMGEDGVAHSL